GKIVHCEGGYQHDLREEISLGDEKRHYRLRNYQSRNTDNYPTHELGPIAKALDINRGNRLEYLVSMASGSWGLNDYAVKNDKVNPALRTFPYRQGDIVKTLIKCAGGETIALTLDTTLPRCYSRGFTVRGTKGLFFEDGNGIYLDGACGEWSKDFYNNKNEFFEKYEHPLWKSETTQHITVGHGGMDWLVYEGFFEYVRNGGTPPIDTYDTATWMAITPLAAKSIENGSIPVEIPDFTGGKWKNRTEICNGIFSLDK
ncbi:MAG: gfo/Idh/MocA family oxidoreductase, partial [Eubacteriales bacterium]|nr:gfo/Idh/MocA family oxidoreductase [Eubacteriales bacterium]